MSDDAELELAPWDVEARLLADHHGGQEAQYRDFVIEKWLLAGGDTRPFLDWVLRLGHCPSRRIIEILAQMMAKSEGIEMPNSMTPDFGLMIDRPGDAGRPRDLESEIQKYAAAAIADHHIENDEAPKKADLVARNLLRDYGFEVGLSTVEASRKKLRKNQGKYLPKAGKKTSKSPRP